jgi:hypothetical protein
MSRKRQRAISISICRDRPICNDRPPQYRLNPHGFPAWPGSCPPRIPAAAVNDRSEWQLRPAIDVAGASIRSRVRARSPSSGERPGCPNVTRVLSLTFLPSSFPNSHHIQMDWATVCYEVSAAMKELCPLKASSDCPPAVRATCGGGDSRMGWPLPMGDGDFACRKGNRRRVGSVSRRSEIWAPASSRVRGCVRAASRTRERQVRQMSPVGDPSNPPRQFVRLNLKGVGGGGPSGCREVVCGGVGRLLREMAARGRWTGVGRGAASQSGSGRPRRARWTGKIFGGSAPRARGSAEARRSRDPM